MIELEKLIKEQEAKGGLDLSKLPLGTVIEAQTKNSLYKITVLENRKYSIIGGKLFINPITTWISGSTWGGSALKLDWIGIGMYIELGGPDGRLITTSSVQSIKIISHNKDWEYVIES